VKAAVSSTTLRRVSGLFKYLGCDKVYLCKATALGLLVVAARNVVTSLWRNDLNDT
jgi:hypothetical protein